MLAHPYHDHITLSLIIRCYVWPVIQHRIVSTFCDLTNVCFWPRIIKSKFSVKSNSKYMNISLIDSYFLCFLVLPGFDKSNKYMSDTLHKATSVTQMLNGDIPHSACKGIWDYLLRPLGLWETFQFPPAEKDFPARWEQAGKQSQVSQVLDFRPKFPPAASTKQYADPGVQARFETQAQQFNCSTIPYPSVYPSTMLLTPDILLANKVVIKLYISVPYVNTLHILGIQLYCVYDFDFLF